MKEGGYIVWHTAAHGKGNTAYDTTAAQINEWHKARGWDGIGYHYVIRFDGTIENGRLKSRTGAHVAGLNGQSIGICFSGHGDIAPLTPKQEAEGIALTLDLMEEYEVPVHHVIGHREVNTLVNNGVLGSQYRTSKTCPGLKVDMGQYRARLGGDDAPTHSTPSTGAILVFTESKPWEPWVLTRQKEAQKALNTIPGISIVEDGWAWRGTSDAIQQLTGLRLPGDRRPT